jgi:hypothetical protein
MALTLTGDGDITGLAVGALPSNVIGADTPAFSVYQNAVTSLTSATFVKVAFQVEEYDTNNCFDNVTNFRFTPNVAGYYQITGFVLTATSSAQIIVSIYKNGAEYKRGLQMTSGQNNGMVTALVYFNGSSDYVELYCYQSAATQNTNPNQAFTYFQGAMVRAA